MHAGRVLVGTPGHRLWVLISFGIVDTIKNDGMACTAYARCRQYQVKWGLEYVLRSRSTYLLDYPSLSVLLCKK
jgi:hypothetical protein